MIAVALAWAEPPEITFGGVVDAYHTVDVDEPPNHDRPPFLYSHARSGEATLNLAMIRLGMERDPVRAALGLMAGTFPTANQGGEIEGLRHLYEAYAGVRVGEGAWVDAGLFPSHLGAESAIGSANPTLSRSLLAESSPYYLAGVRATWAVNDDVTLGAVVANGWQSLGQPPGADAIGGGTQVTFAASDAVTLNWSTWVGRQPGDTTRVFNDVYALVDAGPVELILWGDIGVDDGDVWGGAAVLGRGWFTEHVGLGARMEHLHDPRGVVAVALGDGVVVDGASVNLDLVPLPPDDGELPLLTFRFEARALRSDRGIFGDALGDDVNLAFTSNAVAAF